MVEAAWFFGGMIMAIIGIFALAFALAAGVKDYDEEEWRIWK